jgi:hypothetical protein
MEILSLLFTIVGAIIMIVGGIWMLIEQFKSGILWFLACFFIPFVSLIWLVMHWEAGARPFFLSLGGVVLVVIGAFLGGNF